MGDQGGADPAGGRSTPRSGTRGEIVADKFFEESPRTQELYGAQTERYREFIHEVAKDGDPGPRRSRRGWRTR